VYLRPTVQAVFGVDSSVDGLTCHAMGAVVI